MWRIVAGQRMIYSRYSDVCARWRRSEWAERFTNDRATLPAKVVPVVRALGSAWLLVCLFVAERCEAIYYSVGNRSYLELRCADVHMRS